MSIVVVCQFCRKRYRFRDSDAGQSATCEQCGDVLVVPTPAGAAADLRSAPPRKTPAPAIPQQLWGPLQKLDQADLPKDPGRPAVSESMRNVGIGVGLVIWDVTLSALIYIALALGPVFILPQLPANFPPVLQFRTLAALHLAWVAVVVFGIIGRGLCLLVPGESLAKPYIVTSVVLQLYFVLVTVSEVFTKVPHYVQLSAEISQILAHVLYLGFLRQLASYLRREDLQEESQRSMAHGALFVVAALSAIMSQVFGLPPQIAALFFVANFFISPLLFFPYVRLLYAFRLALKALG